MRHFFSAAILCAASAAHAATPASGTLTEANTEDYPLTYAAGPFSDDNLTATIGEPALIRCSGGNNPCDQYALTFDLPADYADKHPDTYVRIRFKRDVPGDSLLHYVVTDAGTAQTGQNYFAYGNDIADDTQEIYLLPFPGQRTLTVESVPSAVTSSNETVSIALVHIAGEPRHPELPYAAHGNGPRFATYRPDKSPGLGLAAAEPSIGFNPKTGSVFYINTLDTLRVKFDDSTVPARDTWASKHGNFSDIATLDPILYVDQTTGRVFSLQLAGTQSLSEYSDDDGETWLPGGNGFPSSGVDHQSLGAGPYPATTTIPVIHPLYPNAVYYCSQGVAASFCSRSDDGGVTFNPFVPIYTATDCVGLHGHVKVGPTGTAYVPNKGCGLGTESVLGPGVPGLIVSEDAGLTWKVKLVSMAPSDLSTKSDPSVAIGKDDTVYYAYAPLDDHLRVAVSKDHGDTWINDLDVGAIAGIHNAEFPAMVAGDAGRAAVAFLGDTFPVDSADDSGMDFPGVWHFYIASTFDYGAHWFVEQVGDDLSQGPGGIASGGANRNLLDFIDATIDDQGRVLVSYADGCMGGCSATHQGHFTRVAVIARQTGGPRMYAAFDPVEPALPAAPRVTGYRTQDYTVLDIAADSGGAPISGYTIIRDGQVLANNYPATRYVDSTANDAHASYSYQVRALNALGASPASNSYAPAVDENAPVTSATCTLPGMQYADLTGEGEARPAYRDIQYIAIAEPADQPGKLVLTLQNVLALPAQGGATFFLYFDHPDGKRYRFQIDVTGTHYGYYDGRWYEDVTGPLANRLTLVTDGVPPLDASGMSNGTVSFTLDKSAWGLNNGDVLKNFHGTTWPDPQLAEPFMVEDAGYDVSYPIVGNDFCAKGAHLPAPVVDLPASVTASPAATEHGRFGGALPLSLLLGLLGLRAVRRR